MTVEYGRTPSMLTITATCSCGEWAASRPRHLFRNALTKAHRQHQKDAAALAEHEALMIERAFYERTGHCGACGQPGGYCLCIERCGCSDLHPVGSGLDPDAISRFADTGIDRPGLFG